ncbi:hypothetical protein Tco_0984608, partial [Tanacetum coccineum]
METVFRCLTHAPKLPQLDWWPIISRCMRYEDQVAKMLQQDYAHRKGKLIEECIIFSLAHVLVLLLYMSLIAQKVVMEYKAQRGQESKKIRKTIKYFANDKQNQEDAVEVYRPAAKRKVQNSSADVKPPHVKKQHNMKVDDDVSHFQL